MRPTDPSTVKYGQRKFRDRSWGTGPACRRVPCFRRSTCVLDSRIVCDNLFRSGWQYLTAEYDRNYYLQPSSMIHRTELATHVATESRLPIFFELCASYGCHTSDQ